jgi:hypothetical protein
MRIRSVKPEFLRHKGLQKLERENPGQYVMMTFEGLWLASDKQGVFAWDADYLHLDILPFLPFDFDKTLAVLEAAGEIKRFEADGKSYGFIPSFHTHQRISGEEAKQPPRYPEPPRKQEGSSPEAGGKQEGSISEDPSRPGKGNGVGEREREKSARGAMSEPGDPEKGSEENSAPDLPPATPPAPRRFVPPTVDQVRLYCDERGNQVDPRAFVDHYTANNWFRGKTKISDWRACVHTWERRAREDGAKSGGPLALRSDAWDDETRLAHQAALEAKAEGSEELVDIAALAKGTPLGRILAGRSGVG